MQAENLQRDFGADNENRRAELDTLFRELNPGAGEPTGADLDLLDAAVTQMLQQGVQARAALVAAIAGMALG